MFGFRNPFRRRGSAPIRDQRHVVDDWQVGDLAECIWDCWGDTCDTNTSKGDILRVIGITQGQTTDGTNMLIIALTFEGKPASHYWDNRAFRKLRPLISECSDGWGEWLRDKVKPREAV